MQQIARQAGHPDPDLRDTFLNRPFDEQIERMNECRASGLRKMVASCIEVARTRSMACLSLAIWMEFIDRLHPDELLKCEEPELERSTRDWWEFSLLPDAVQLRQVDTMSTTTLMQLLCWTTLCSDLYEEQQIENDVLAAILTRLDPANYPSFLPDAEPVRTLPGPGKVDVLHVRSETGASLWNRHDARHMEQ